MERLQPLQAEVETLRHSRKAAVRTLKKAVLRGASHLMKTLDSVESKFGMALGHLDMQIRTLKTSSAQIPLLTLMQPAEIDQTSDSDDFMVQLVYGIKSIESLTQEYANLRTLKVKYMN
jgi:hypothetical protein